MNVLSLRSLRPVITGSREVAVRPTKHESPRQRVRGAITAPEAASALRQLFLSGSFLPGWKLVQPLPLALELDSDGLFLVSDSIVAVYGLGNNPQAALEDYRTSLIEYYSILERYDDEPSQALLRQLKQYLQPE